MHHRIRHQFAQHLEQLAEGARRFAGLALVPRIADERAQALGVGLRMADDPVGDRGVILQQAHTPAFERVLPRDLPGRNTAQRIELRADRGRVDLAHHLAHELKLAAQGAEGADAARLDHGLAQRLGQIDPA